MWKKELLQSIQLSKSADTVLPLTPLERNSFLKFRNKFPLQITPSYAQLIDWNDPADPLKKLIMPSNKEEVDDGELDTSGEAMSVILQGLQHKYKQTAVIILTQACAAHCRYCFRRRLLSKDIMTNESISDLKQSLDYIKSHKEIDNILLSGGDPMISSTKRLEKLFRACEEIPHIKQIRISTKLPAFLPARFTTDKELLKLLASLQDRFQFIFQIHFDHPAEITKQSMQAIQLLDEIGCSLTSQIPLMKGINDNPTILTKLFQELHLVNVIPQYLFHPRPVKHATHFQLALSKGVDIVEQVRSNCAGPVKRFRYILTLEDGKLEIIDKIKISGKTYLIVKWHQLRRGLKKEKRTSLIKLTRNSVWISNQDLEHHVL